MRRTSPVAPSRHSIAGDDMTNADDHQMHSDASEAQPLTGVEPPEEVATTGRNQQEGSSGLYICVLSAFSGIAGFLFGYDTGNISGALPYITEDLLLKYSYNTTKLHWIQGLIVSAAVAGAAVGSALGGFWSDRCGRKFSLKAADIFFAIGALVMALASDATILILGRLITGFGIGLASVVAPVYIAETAPTPWRATLVTVNNLMITAGQFVAFFLDYIFTFAPGTWRWMLGIAVAPAIFQIIGLAFLPESPRWLLSKGRVRESAEALGKLRGNSGYQEEFQEACSAANLLNEQQSPLEALRRPEVLKELHLGIGLQVWQQLCGINTVMYYTPTLLTLSGVRSNRMALLISMGPAAVNMLGTVVGMTLIDRVGRRKLLVSSIVGVILALVFLGSAFKASETHSDTVISSTCPIEGIKDCHGCLWNACTFCSLPSEHHAGVCIAASEACPTLPPSLKVEGSCPSPYLPLVIAGVILYLAAFSPGLGPVPWSVNAEIFPLEVRGLANGAAATSNWIANAIVSQLFLSLADSLSSSGVFWLLAGIACAAGIWTYLFLPETKGLSLEEIQVLFVEKPSRVADAGSDS